MSNTQNTSTANTTAETAEVEAPENVTTATAELGSTEVIEESLETSEEVEPPATNKAGREAAKYRTQLRAVETERDQLKERLAEKETELAVIHLDRRWNITNDADVELLMNVADPEKREALAKRISVNNSIVPRKDTSNEDTSNEGPNWSGAMNGDWK